MSVAFVLCVEEGNLENQADLLVRSLRQWGGRYADSRIVAYKPREGPPLQTRTLHVFDELGVELDDAVRNRELQHYPIANKVFVTAAAEEELGEDVIVFLDSDTVILNEPSDLDLGRDQPVALRPVDRKGRGSEGPGDRAEAYWTRLYELCDVRDDRFVTTTLDRIEIRAYWNAGLVAARRDAGLFGRWLEHLRILVAADHLPGGKMTNLDQAALSTATATVPQVLELDDRYNYALPWRPRLPEPMRSLSLDDLVHVHYHQWFNRPDYLALVRPPFDPESSRYAWLAQFLPFAPVIHDRPVTGPGLVPRALQRRWRGRLRR
jgi:hypothetical protein